MKKKKKPAVTIIKRSLLTGMAVWIYRGSGAAKTVWAAYDRARRSELERVSHWSEHVAQRKANILRMLNDCMANMPINEPLPPEVEAAARRLVSMAETPPDIDLEFYNHIMEEKRRREEDKRIRMQMREREQAERLARQEADSRKENKQPAENHENRNYDK